MNKKNIIKKYKSLLYEAIFKLASILNQNVMEMEIFIQKHPTQI